MSLLHKTNLAPKLSPVTKANEILTDQQLRNLIVSGVHGWREAYDELLQNRYGAFIYRKAQDALSSGPHTVPLDASVYASVMNILFAHLYGNRTPEAGSGSWSRLREWHPSIAFQEWLDPILERICQHVRRTHPTTTRSLVEQSDRVTVRVNPELTEVLRTLLSALEEACRRILWLRIFEHLDNRAVADVLSMSELEAQKRYIQCKEELRIVL